MRIETVCTGDELLTGLTADTNSRFFQEQLLDRVGVQVQRSVVVGDVREDIIGALKDVGSRCDAVLVSGGMGPTTDDITIECAAAMAGVGLTEDPAVRAHLEERFKKRNITVSPNNLRQIRVPEGADGVINQAGSAPMVVQKVGTCTFFYVPGVPSEYRWLVEHEVIPRILKLGGSRTVRKLRLLKTIGLPESHLDQRVMPLHAKYPNLVIGFRTHAPENHLKLLAVAPDAAQADQLLTASEADAMQLLGSHVFGFDDDTLAGVVAKLLLARKQTLTTAESCSGGRIASLVTAEAGASDWYLGGGVTYVEAVKEKWLGVKAETLKQHTAVSEPVAREMAQGVRSALGSTWGLSVTGYAGPTGGDALNPVGTVYIGLSGPKVDAVERHAFPFSDRNRVQAFAAHTALDMLRRTLQTVGP